MDVISDLILSVRIEHRKSGSLLSACFIFCLILCVSGGWLHMSHSQMLGKVASGGGPIFKVVLEC